MEEKLIVVGNRSCDLDSTVSALIASYLIEQNALKDFTVKYKKTVPLLLQSQESLKYTPEIKALFDYLSLDPTPYLWEGEKKVQGDLFLVDHNEPDLKWKERHTITGIIDHHKDSQTLYPSYKQIKPCGSCTSLIASLGKNIQSLDYPYLMMIGAAIVVDTGNFNPYWKKTTALDLSIFNSIKEQFNLKDRNFLIDLLGIKKNLSHLTAKQLIARDYKEIHLLGARIGIPSIPESFIRFKNKCPHIKETFQRELESRNLDMLLPLFTNETPFQREISFYPEENPFKIEENFIKNNLFQKKISDQKLPFNTYSLKDPSLSRKKIIPLVTELLF